MLKLKNPSDLSIKHWGEGYDIGKGSWVENPVKHLRRSILQK